LWTPVLFVATANAAVNVKRSLSVREAKHFPSSLIVEEHSAYLRYPSLKENVNISNCNCWGAMNGAAVRENQAFAKSINHGFCTCTLANVCLGYTTQHDLTAEYMESWPSHMIFTPNSCIYLSITLFRSAYYVLLLHCMITTRGIACDKALWIRSVVNGTPMGALRHIPIALRETEEITVMYH